MFEKGINLTHFQECLAYSRRLIPRCGKTTELQNKPAGSLLVHPIRPRPPESPIWSLKTELRSRQLTLSPPPSPSPILLKPLSARMVLNHLHERSSSRFRGSQRGRCPQSSDIPGMAAQKEGRGGAFGGVGTWKVVGGGWRQQVLTRVRKAQPGSSRPRCGGSPSCSRVSRLPRGRPPGLGSLRWWSGALLRPPTASGSHGSGLRCSTRSSWNSCRCPSGWRLPTGQTIRLLRPGVHDVPRGAGAWGRRWLEGTEDSGNPLPLRSHEVLYTGVINEGAAASSGGLLKTPFELSRATPPLPVCLGPARGSFRTRQTEDLATRAPGRRPSSEMREALASAPPPTSGYLPTPRRPILLPV